MNVEWVIPVRLRSPQGDLFFNYGHGSDQPNYLFLLDQAKCLAGPPSLRTTSDDIPQGDGWIIHRSFRTGTLVKLAIEFWVGTTEADAKPACGSDLRAMWDRLMLHCEALRSPSQADLDGGNARIRWTPSGSGDRILDRVQMFQWPTPAFDGVVTSAELTLQCPYPYAIDLTQHTTNLANGGAPVTLTNLGTAAFYPVFKLHGPITTFSQIDNITTGLEIHYDATLPGSSPVAGGDYVEIDTFRNTAYLNGDGANRKPGIDVLLTDFFPLVVGANSLQVLGDGSCDVLWNNAWS